MNPWRKITTCTRRVDNMISRIKSVNRIVDGRPFRTGVHDRVQAIQIYFELEFMHENLLFFLFDVDNPGQVIYSAVNAICYAERQYINKENPNVINSWKMSDEVWGMCDEIDKVATFSIINAIDQEDDWDGVEQMDRVFENE